MPDGSLFTVWVPQLRWTDDLYTNSQYMYDIRHQEKSFGAWREQTNSNEKTKIAIDFVSEKFGEMQRWY